jgi:hypothetical protein
MQSWVPALLASEFFKPCEAHAGGVVNIFSLDSGAALCPACAQKHPAASLLQARASAPAARALRLAAPANYPATPRTASPGRAACRCRRAGARRRSPARGACPLQHAAELRPAAAPQIRRSSYHDVVRVVEIGRLLDTAGVQARLRAPRARASPPTLTAVRNSELFDQQRTSALPQPAAAAESGQGRARRAGRGAPQRLPALQPQVRAAAAARRRDQRLRWRKDGAALSQRPVWAHAACAPC